MISDFIFISLVFWWWTCGVFHSYDSKLFMLGLSFLPWTGRIVAHNVRAKNLMNNIYCLLLILSEDAKNPRDKWLIQVCTADGRSKLESMMRIFPLYLIYPNYCCSFLNVLYLSLSLPSFSLSPSPSHPTPPPPDIQMNIIPLDRFPIDSLSWSAPVIHVSTTLQMHKPDTCKGPQILIISYFTAAVNSCYSLITRLHEPWTLFVVNFAQENWVFTIILVEMLIITIMTKWWGLKTSVGMNLETEGCQLVCLWGKSAVLNVDYGSVSCWEQLDE